MSRFIASALGFVLCFSLSSVCGLAQSSGQVVGSVADETGARIVAASITLDNGQGRKFTATTDEAGRFKLESVPPGTYNLTVSAEGFQTQTQQVAIKTSAPLQLKVVLKVQIQEQMVVKSDNQGISTEPGNNLSAITMSGTDLDSLPDDPDEMMQTIQEMAGSTGSPGDVTLYVDGFEEGGRLPPKESIQMIKINSDPFSSQYSEHGAGRTQIITKPGSLDFHGGFRFNFNDAVFNARKPFAPFRAPLQTRSYNGYFSGPIIKNKLGFFLSFERREQDENAVINATTLDPETLQLKPFSDIVQTPFRLTHFTIRSDYQLTTKHTIRFWFRRSENDGTNQGLGGGFDLPERAYSTSSTDDTLRLAFTSVVSERMVNEARMELSKRSSGQTANSAAPAVIVFDAFNSGGNQGSLFNDNSNKNLQLTDDVTYTYGKHTIKFGARAVGSEYGNLNRSNFEGTFTFGSDFLRDANGQPILDSAGQPTVITPLDAYRNTLLGLPGYHPLQFSILRGDPFVGFTQWGISWYAQDDFRISPNFTLSFGLRNELQTHLPDKTNFAPRLSFAWAPGKSHNSTVRGGVGIFYSGVSSGITSDAIRYNGISEQQFVISHPDFFPAIPTSFTGFPSQTQTIRIKAPDLNMPYAVISSIGYERKLPARMFGTVTYTYQRGEHLLRTRDINAPLPGAGALPFPGQGPILQFESTGRSVRHELRVTLRNNFSERIHFFAHYILATTRSDTDGAYTTPANSYDLADEFGRAGYDSRHRFFIGGSLSLPLYFRISPFIFIRSGLPFNITTGRDNNGDTLFSDRPAFAIAGTPGAIVTPIGVFNPNPGPGDQIIPRNFGNGPGQVSFNLYVSKTFGFGPALTDSGQRGGPGHHHSWDVRTNHKYNLTLNLNMRNVINHTNLGNFNGVLTSPLFDLANTANDGRRIELALRFNF